MYFDLALVDTLALGFIGFLVATLALGFTVPLTTVLVAVLLVAACAAGIPAVPTISDNSAPRARAVGCYNRLAKLKIYSRWLWLRFENRRD
ncbi:hypothetical protein QUB68_19210 [Microcoleus sp. A006_D1]|uniref:hypothetical protein n=1 Tax=Microcoleus sp. A006_D1 TaxID=3055267 RepID=UPI002FD43942